MKTANDPRSRMPFSTSSQSPQRRPPTSPSLRIASLFPAGTEWVAALGAADRLVARSHACDYPESIRSLPVVTRPKRVGSIPEFASRENPPIEAGAAGEVAACIDLDALTDLEPDLIIIGSESGFGAAAKTRGRPNLATILEGGADTFAFDAISLKGILEKVLLLGRRIGRFEAAMEHLAAGERRIRELQERVGVPRLTGTIERPSVLCLNRLEPLTVAGTWIPDLVEAAGGRSLLAQRGEPARTLAWQEAAEARPDVIAIIPQNQSIEEAGSVLKRAEAWREMTAARQGRIYLFDGAAYFNRPGPRLFRSIELLSAALFGPVAQADPKPWEVRRLKNVSRSEG